MHFTADLHVYKMLVQPSYSLVMEHFGLLVVVVLCFVGIVSGAGYEGKRPQSQGACYYDDINKAHFSYERDNCEGEKIK